jgi:SAM-dependent methyltransferase
LSSIVNTAQAEAWNGYEGQHWASHDDRYDAVNGGFNGYLLDEVAARDQVLDIGCGNGQLTRLAAGRAAGATGVDLSEPMLGTARARSAGVENVSFVRGDVQVHPFEAGKFDVAISRFGVMFFDDPVVAFANVRRALGLGGRLAFVCMTALAGTDMGTVFDSMSAYLPRPTGSDGTGPTSFADPARTAKVLTAAGFSDVTSTHVEAEQVWGKDISDAAAFIAAWGPVRYHMGLVGPDTAAKARAALTDVLGSYASDAGVVLRGTAWLVRASA